MKCMATTDQNVRVLKMKCMVITNRNVWVLQTKCIVTTNQNVWGLQTKCMVIIGQVYGYHKLSYIQIPRPVYEPTVLVVHWSYISV